MHPQLKVAVARHTLQLADADDLIDAAHAALDEAIYSYSLGELATQAEPSPSDSDRWFRAAVQELGLRVPGRDECISILIQDAVTRIVEGAEPPASVVERLYADYVGLNYANELRDWAKHQYAIEERRAYTAEPMFHMPLVWPEEPSDLLADIVRHAWEWGRKRWAWVIPPDWRTSAVVGLAAAIREEKAFDRLPILADALQDAGCEDADILDHLCYSRPHVTCCWVVELLLEPRP
ncbi:hypothetical protein [Limnoglobus roseus]|uniref:SMI1/KNR4 family protein n=1 Tax=Limnoglobus roseus TaxID=2598579 RepID=A0A5C1A8H8_9BACT|nr:hypothetical protein [Limnoglobus roseus]QEL15050.1 SMI1/KNR4 family protein [Limnoglobus roseus]